MKKKILFLIILCLFFNFCKSHPQEKTWVQSPIVDIPTKVIAQEAVSFDNYTFDEVWNASEKTLIKLGYAYVTFDKDQGKLVARIKQNTVGVSGVEDMEPPLAYETQRYYCDISISEEDGKVILNCKVSKEMPASDPLKKGKRELNRVLKTLKENLKELR